MKKIARNYITGWFFIDLVALIPIQMFESMFGSKELKLARLARIPRLYRLVRILRMLKMLRIFKRSSEINEWMNSLDIYIGLIRMLKVLSLSLFLIHLMSCFWYMGATLQEDIWGTWVGKAGIVDDEWIDHYVYAFYWAFQTVTTVGYGDFAISTVTEYVLALLWMTFGSTIYQYTIASVSGLIAANDSKQNQINNKINILNQYSIKYQLPATTHKKILNYFN